MIQGMGNVERGGWINGFNMVWFVACMAKSWLCWLLITYEVIRLRFDE